MLLVGSLADPLQRFGPAAEEQRRDLHAPRAEGAPGAAPGVEDGDLDLRDATDVRRGRAADRRAKVLEDRDRVAWAMLRALSLLRQVGLRQEAGPRVPAQPMRVANVRAEVDERGVDGAVLLRDGRCLIGQHEAYGDAQHDQEGAR